MRELVDMTLDEIIDHPEFVSIEKVNQHDSYAHRTYLVTFESNTRAGNNAFMWVTCTGVRIDSKRYVFHTYLGRNNNKDGRIKTNEDKGVQG